MFLLEVLALGSLLYRNCLALEVSIYDYGTLLHGAHIVEVDVAQPSREEVHLVCLVDAVAKGFVIVECLLAQMPTEALPAYEASVFVIG